MADKDGSAFVRDGNAPPKTKPVGSPPEKSSTPSPAKLQAAARKKLAEARDR
jgi:hypothetical protein